MSRKISAREIVADIKQGLSNDDLKQKYELSQSQLEKLMSRLIDAGLISPDEFPSAKNIRSESQRHPQAAPASTKSPGPQSASDKTTQTDHALNPTYSKTENSRLNSKDQESADVNKDALRRLERNAWIGISLGLFGELIGPGIAAAVDRTGVLAALVFVAGLGVLFWGCYNLAKRKGYHGAAALLGLFSCFGVPILLLMPSRNSERRMSPAVIAAIIVVCAFLFVSVMGIIAAIAVPESVVTVQ